MSPDEPSEPQQKPVAEGSSPQDAGRERPRYRSRRPRFRRGGGRGGPRRADDQPASRGPAPSEEPRRSQPTGSIQDAIAHTRDIQAELESVLEDLNEVLHILEVAEREKNASEDEIETLRESLHRLQRDRGGTRGPRPSSYRAPSSAAPTEPEPEREHGADDDERKD